MMGCCSQACKDFIQLPEYEQKRLRSGIDKGRNVFNKSRSRMNAVGKQITDKS
jgi:UPF0176 protein